MASLLCSSNLWINDSSSSAMFLMVLPVFTETNMDETSLSRDVLNQPLSLYFIFYLLIKVELFD